MRNSENMSLEEKTTYLMGMATSLGYKEDMMTPSGCQLSHLILDFLPGFMSKWIEGRMSIADMNKYTPEYVEHRIDIIIRAMEIKRYQAQLR